MGVALSAPEKLQAIPGPWTEWIIELQKKYIIETHTLGDKLDWDTKRGKPFQALTAFIMLAYEANQTTAPTSSLMAKFLNRGDPVSILHATRGCADLCTARPALQAQDRDGALTVGQHRNQLLRGSLPDETRASRSCR